jgi:hypothetical protein
VFRELLHHIAQWRIQQEGRCLRNYLRIAMFRSINQDFVRVSRESTSIILISISSRKELDAYFIRTLHIFNAEKTSYFSAASARGARISIAVVSRSGWCFG